MFNWHQKILKDSSFRDNTKNNFINKINVDIELLDQNKEFSHTIQSSTLEDQVVKQFSNKVQENPQTGNYQQQFEQYPNLSRDISIEGMPPPSNQNLVKQQSYIAESIDLSDEEQQLQQELNMHSDTQQVLYEGQQVNQSNSSSSNLSPKNQIPLYQNGSQKQKTQNQNQNNIVNYQKLPSRYTSGTDDRSSLYNGGNIKLSDSEKGSVYSTISSYQDQKIKPGFYDNKVYTLDDLKGSNISSINSDENIQKVQVVNINDQGSEISLSRNLTGSPTSHTNIRVNSPFLLSQRSSKEINDQEIDSYNKNFNCILKDPSTSPKALNSNINNSIDLSSHRQFQFAQQHNPLDNNTDYYEALSQEDLSQLDKQNYVLKNQKSKSYGNIQDCAIDRELDANLNFLEQLDQDDVDFDQKQLIENMSSLDDIIQKMEKQQKQEKRGQKYKQINVSQKNPLNNQYSMSRKLSDGYLEYKYKNRNKEFRQLASHKLVKQQDRQSNVKDRNIYLKQDEIQYNNNYNNSKTETMQDKITRLFQTRLKLDNSLEGANVVENLLKGDGDQLKIDSLWDQTLESHNLNTQKDTLTNRESLKEAIKQTLQVPTISNPQNQNISLSSWSLNNRPVLDQNVQLQGIKEMDENRASPTSSFANQNNSKNLDEQNINSQDSIDLRYFRQNKQTQLNTFTEEDSKLNILQQPKFVQEQIKFETAQQQNSQNQNIVTLSNNQISQELEPYSNLQDALDNPQIYNEKINNIERKQSSITGKEQVLDDQDGTSQAFSGVGDILGSPKTQTATSQDFNKQEQTQDLMSSDFSMQSQLLGQMPQAQQGINYAAIQNQYGIQQQMFPVQVMTPQGPQLVYYIFNPYQQAMMGYNQAQYVSPYFQNPLMMNQQQPMILPINPFLQISPNQMAGAQVQQGMYPSQSFAQSNDELQQQVGQIDPLQQFQQMQYQQFQAQQNSNGYSQNPYNYVPQKVEVQPSQSSNDQNQDRQESTIYQSPRSYFTQANTLANPLDAQENSMNYDRQSNHENEITQDDSLQIKLDNDISSSDSFQRAMTRVREVYSPNNSSKQQQNNRGVTMDNDSDLVQAANSTSSSRKELPPVYPQNQPQFSSSPQPQLQVQSQNQVQAIQEPKQSDSQIDSQPVEEKPIMDLLETQGFTQDIQTQRSQDSSQQSKRSHLEIDSPTSWLQSTRSFQDLMDSQKYEYFQDNLFNSKKQAKLQNKERKTNFWDRKGKESQKRETSNNHQKLSENENLTNNPLPNKEVNKSALVDKLGKPNKTLSNLSSNSKGSLKKALALELPQENSSAYQLSYLQGDSGNYNNPGTPSIYDLSPSTTQMNNYGSNTPNSYVSRKPFNRKGRQGKNKSRSLLCGCVGGSCVDNSNLTIDQFNKQKLLDSDDNQSPQQSPRSGMYSKIASDAQNVRKQGSINSKTQYDNSTDNSYQPLLQDTPKENSKVSKKNSFFRRKPTLTIDIDNPSGSDSMLTAKSDLRQIKTDSAIQGKSSDTQDLILLEDNGIFALKPQGPLPQKLYQDQGQPISPRATSPMAQNFNRQIMPLSNIDNIQYNRLSNSKNCEYSNYAYQLDNFKMDGIQADLLNSQSSKIKHYPGDYLNENTSLIQQDSQAVSSFMTVKSNQAY